MSDIFTKLRFSRLKCDWRECTAAEIFRRLRLVWRLWRHADCVLYALALASMVRRGRKYKTGVSAHEVAREAEKAMKLVEDILE